MQTHSAHPKIRPRLWRHAQHNDTGGAPWSGKKTRGEGGFSRLPFLFKITRGHSQTRDQSFQGNFSKFTAGPKLNCSRTLTSNWFQVVLTSEAHPENNKNT